MNFTNELQATDTKFAANYQAVQNALTGLDKMAPGTTAEVVMNRAEVVLDELRSAWEDMGRKRREMQTTLEALAVHPGAVADVRKVLFLARDAADLAAVAQQYEQLRKEFMGLVKVGASLNLW